MVLCPFTHCFDEAIRAVVIGQDCLPFSRFFEDILYCFKRELYNIQNVVFAAPVVIVFCEGTGFQKPVWDATTSVAFIKETEPFDTFMFNIEVRSGIATSCEA